MEEPEPFPRILSPCSSGRRSNDSKSPEFEFWMVRNPSFPQPNVLSADELFSGGFLLPLHHLHLSNDPPPQDLAESSVAGQTLKPDPNPADLSAAPALTSSKRWRDIFKKSDNVNGDDRSSKEKGTSVKDNKREKKSGGSSGGNGVSGAELNINIWPFSRSRSAGNGGTRPRSAATSRKVSSAPCSRSNSAGESKSRKWPSSPSRAAGVHLGRSSPVWQVRRSAAAGGGKIPDGKVKSTEKGVRDDGIEGYRKIPATAHGGVGSKTRALSLNVPMCIGYRHNLSCRSDENSAVSIAAAAAGGGGGQNAGVVAGEGARGSNFFNIKGFFSKKVY